MRRAAIITATVLALAACGGDDDDKPKSAGTKAVAAGGDVDRYCALGRELDAAGEKFFAGLGEDASPKQFEAAERRFIERFAGKLTELQRVAPQQIKADVATVLGAQRGRAGLPADSQPSESEASAADTRVRAYEKRSCGA